ncbi:glycosyltransferase family 9 protein [Dongshaea marina]|uniref:glycosyltransferase family 9 protein n=1 Tax=Dongshaea marina TaxID=2047966 RepID=UPI000D3E4EEF|nr:glycosyltransferase family 9 protein [Dongshaea marina]
MKYLVVQTKEIGDVLFSTSLCNTLKLNFPNAQVDYLVMDYCAGMAENNPHIDNIIKIDKKQKDSWRYLWSLMMKLRRQNYDMVINSQGQIIGLLTCLFSGAPRRIGFNSKFWQVAHTERIAFREATEDQGNGWIIDDRFALLKPLGLKYEDRSYKIWLVDTELEQGKEKLVAAGVDLSKPLVALGVSVRGLYKRWPIQYFEKVAAHLIKRHGAQLLVYSGPGEQEYNQQLKKMLPEDLQVNVFDEIETSSVRDLCGLFSHCQLFFGNDTGPRNMAQALGLPTLCVASPRSDKDISHPRNHPRFRGLSTGDALGLSEEEWLKLRAEKITNENQFEWFEKLTPEFAIQELDRMVDELGLFDQFHADI